MIIRRKKPSVLPGDGKPAMRGRENAENTENPLARRFHLDDEPDTIDLQRPAGFNNSDPEPEEPATSTTGSSPAGAASTTSEQLSVISIVPGSGKLYVQPGEGDSRTSLGDEPVGAPTELRRGDRIRIGDFELQIL